MSTKTVFADDEEAECVRLAEDALAKLDPGFDHDERQWYRWGFHAGRESLRSAKNEQLRDLVSKQQREIRELQDSRSVALKIIADQQHELARLRRALSHS